MSKWVSEHFLHLKKCPKSRAYVKHAFHMASLGKLVFLLGEPINAAGSCEAIALLLILVDAFVFHEDIG